jgi:hypothetical protein
MQHRIGLLEGRGTLLRWFQHDAGFRRVVAWILSRRSELSQINPCHILDFAIATTAIEHTAASRRKEAFRETVIPEWVANYYFIHVACEVVWLN